MNKYIKIAVWAFLFSILVSGIALTVRAFAYDKAQYDSLSHEYDRKYNELLIRKIREIPNGARVILYLKDESVVKGKFDKYNHYDDSVWITEDGHWFETAYLINDLFDICIDVKEPI